MSSPVVCREIFDENSQPSAEEISDYAQQLGIDPESESHLLPLAKDGLMQALPPPWKAYYDDKIQSHYYYNEDTKRTQWEHPLDNVYRELVKKARDASMQDDTCASVQELLTSEENTKNLERVETKVESDEELSTDSENHASDVRENPTLTGPRRLTPLGRPPPSPLTRLDKKLSDTRISPLRRSVDGALSGKPNLMRNTSDRDLLSRSTFGAERPKLLFKQQSEIIDLKMHVLNSPEEENFSPLLMASKVDRGFPLTGKGNMFLKVSKSDLPSPDTDKSLPIDSVTKSDPPKGILREKMSDPFYKKVDNMFLGRQKQPVSFEEDRKSVRFKLENLPEPTVSPGSNSSSEQNDGQSSIISAPPHPAIPSPIIPSSPLSPSPFVSSPVMSPSQVPLNQIVLTPLSTRPPLPPRPNESPRDTKSLSGSERDSVDSESHARGTSPRRRVLRPPPGDYIKPDLFQKNFQKISDLVRPGDIDTLPVSLEEPGQSEKETRPRSPMIPQKSKISINLMESIESETSIDSPDREFANLDLNDLDESNENQKNSNEKEIEKDLTKSEDVSEKKSISSDKRSISSDKKSISLERNRSNENIPIPQIKVPILDFSKAIPSDSDDSKKSSIREEDSKSKSHELSNMKSPQIKVSPTPSLGTEMRSPRLDYSKPWSPLSTFKPLNKSVLSPQIKTSDSASSIGKGLTSPRLDGVILSQGKSSSDNVVVVYQFETQEESFPKPIKSPLIPDMGTRDLMERNKADERRRLELALQKELESIRLEWSVRERKLRGELLEELREAEDRFLAEKRMRLSEQAERHKREMDEALTSAEQTHRQTLEQATLELEERNQQDIELAERKHSDNMNRLHQQYRDKLIEQQRQLEIENERALCELREQLQANLSKERARMIEENRATIESLREEHTTKVTDLRHDYRAEIERLRSVHACHVEEVRARLASERAAAAAAARHPDRSDRALHDKYRCLKEKYVRLKHDVKMSIERRNKRREMSMTTGSETEKSNSHKANQSLERCKEVNETSVSAVVEPEPRTRINNNPSVKYNDNETSYSESNAHKPIDNNNEDWKLRRDNSVPPAEPSQTSVKRARGRTAVAFREPPRRRDDRDTGATTDCQDSSDATTADEKPKENVNGHGRRRCFTRLKSASTSRLNYSPKRGEGWSSPLESLRQQLRKLDDLEDQFPDLACQPAYSLRYPFSELGPVTTADTPELEFVRHRALVEREGMRRARAALKRRKAALRETRASLSPHRAPSPEGTTSSASSASSAGAAPASGGAVLRSLRALHADVRDIWRALDARRPHTASPETSSCNAATTSQTRMTLSAPEPVLQDNSDGGVAERARGLRAWLQTAP
ncbi:F-actin-monooxygenase MICAL3 isoform X2 [Spodoptera frugiperda]|uniref:F-actin-monooxygenase MICAL3 isoform X2 n=1 Tax=Spodoptera frugiperda TaxID=7108 RepID=A0A9R0EJG6_SPOFR|nr:F-actin-monooxygenase MICAL3 isoform X2 [Spodoptera frugiperda]